MAWAEWECGGQFRTLWTPECHSGSYKNDLMTPLRVIKLQESMKYTLWVRGSQRGSKSFYFGPRIVQNRVA